MQRLRYAVSRRVHEDFVAEFCLRMRRIGEKVELVLVVCVMMGRYFGRRMSREVVCMRKLCEDNVGAETYSFQCCMQRSDERILSQQRFLE